MKHYIVAFDLNDPFVGASANYLIKILPTADTKFADTNQVEDWPDPDNNCTLWLIDHGSGRQFGDHNDPNRFLKENEKVKAVYKMATTVVLVSCSTADESQIVSARGFQPATFAKNLKDVDKKKTIVAAVGLVFASSTKGFIVPTELSAQRFASREGWITY